MKLLKVPVEYTPLDPLENTVPLENALDESSGSVRKYNPADVFAIPTTP